MKKILLILPLIGVMGAAGYFAEPYLFRPPEQAKADEVEMPEAAPREVLFKMPLGKFVVQVPRNRQSIHILFDIDLYMAGAANFERLNGAEGRARLRDATVQSVAEITETALWIDNEDLTKLDPRRMAEEVVRKLYPTFPMMRTARINELHANVSTSN